ncbi:MAG: T9SS type A sorting domain-containing protein [Cyclobacteriaceae bacterium]|nr:T9SS type A sorting domain-containing protein [Cyclobacteriaceae bacterium]
MNWSRKALLGIIVCLFWSFSAQSAEFFRKQTGTVVLAGAGSAASVTVTIEPVCMGSSFLMFSSTSNDTDPGDFHVGGQITNNTTLTFTRNNNSTATVTIKWQVFEFSSGVTVQRGITAAGTGATNVTISSVDLTKSFVIATQSVDGTTMGDNDAFTANLTTTTNLQLTVTAGTPQIYWQVVTYNESIVKKFTTTLSAGSTSTTTTISPAITTLSKAFVISYHTISANVNADDLPRTVLTNSSTVTYTRVGSTATMNFVTYVIEFTDLSTVSRGSQAFGSTVVTQNVTTSSAASSGVFGPGHAGKQGSTSFATDDNPGHAWFTYELNSSSNLLIQRATGTAGGNSTATAPWQVVTFEDQNSSPTTYYSFADGAWDSNLSWSLSSDGSTGVLGAGVYPLRTDNVVIQNGHDIVINAVNDNGLCGISPDNLNRSNVGTFTGSGDLMFYHTGDIIVANGGSLTSSEEVMFEGYSLVENGGTLSVTEDIVNLGYFELAPTANFSNTDDLILSGNSITIIDNLSFGADDIYIDHTNATLCGEGVMNLGNGGADPTIQFFNGGSLNQVCSTFSVTCTSNCGAFPITPTGNFSTGNSGPGGVATTNGASELEYWIDANSGVTGSSPITAWTDLSGNGVTNTVNGNPALTTSALNGRSVVTFDGAGDRIQTNLNINAGTRPDLSIISVYVPVATSTSGSVWGESNGNYDRALTAANGTGGCTNATTTGSACVNDASLFPTGTSVITTIVFDEDVASGSAAYTNGNSVLTFTSNHAPGDGSNSMQVGDVGVGGFIPYTGSVAEVIVLSNIVNNAKRIIIENYLDAKYHNDAAPAFSNDVYTMDNSANGDYDFEVAGIGQASDGSNHRDAKGTGIVRMWNPKNLGNSEFLMWGHDNATLASSTTSGVAAPIQERLSRIWRVSESGDVGNVSISFDFSSVGGSPIGSNLRLLIDRDGDGFGDNDVTPIAGSVSNGIAVFSNVNFQSGDRFTLGNTDASSPLPVSLVYFEALPANELVLVKWKTESELDNEQFTVERSTDAEQWNEVTSVVGAGTSTEVKHYQILDYDPIQGKSYYRLKQTDFDGKFDYSPIVAVEFTGRSALFVSPNPTQGLITIKGQDIGQDQVRVFNAQGIRISPRQYVEEGRLQVDLSSFSSGVYIIQVSDGIAIRTTRLVKY